MTKKEKLKLAEKRKTSYQELYCTRFSKTNPQPPNPKEPHLKADANPKEIAASVYQVYQVTREHRPSTDPSIPTGHMHKSCMHNRDQQTPKLQDREPEMRNEAVYKDLGQAWHALAYNERPTRETHKAAFWQNAKYEF